MYLQTTWLGESGYKRNSKTPRWDKRELALHDAKQEKKRELEGPNKAVEALQEQQLRPHLMGKT